MKISKNREGYYTTTPEFYSKKYEGLIHFTRTFIFERFLYEDQDYVNNYDTYKILV